MPFDSTPQAESLTDLYMRRRRDANAAVLAAVAAWGPDTFNMDVWGGGEGSCGSAACYLGWLAALRHDGWISVASGEGPRRFHRIPQRNGETAFFGAAAYFGLTLRDAHRCFGTLGPRERRRRRAEGVASMLLGLPVWSAPPPPLDF